MVIRTGILASIYRAIHMGDCSNHGLSSKFHTVVMVSGEDTLGNSNPVYIYGPFYPDPKTPAVELRQNQFGDVFAIPVEAPHGKDRAMAQFGGTYIATSDSRFSQSVLVYGAIPLHDRWE